MDGWNRTNTSVLNADYFIERVKHQVHPPLQYNRIQILFKADYG
ncbi:hypothetical protein [Enterococcus pingfangensis]